MKFRVRSPVKQSFRFLLITFMIRKYCFLLPQERNTQGIELHRSSSQPLKLLLNSYRLHCRLKLFNYSMDELQKQKIHSKEKKNYIFMLLYDLIIFQHLFYCLRCFIVALCFQGRSMKKHGNRRAVCEKMIEITP